MPNIRGTNGDDDIEVTGDEGTLNGTPQGTPIDDIRARGGDDEITIVSSTISGSVSGNAGNDEITVSNAQIDGQINAGRDADTVSVFDVGVGNIRLGQGNDTLNFIRTQVAGDVRGGGGQDALNLPVGTTVTDDNFGTLTVVVGQSYSLSSGSFELPSGIVVNYSGFESGTGFLCFTRDTVIQAQRGPVLIQDLRQGDMIPTQGNGMQPIRWIGRRKFDSVALAGDPKRRPVRILAGALGNGLPKRDLLVSRQHRMLVQSKIAERMFGETEVLIPAMKLTALLGIFVDDTVDSVEYYHLLFDRHEVIFAENAPSESLFTGPEALKTLSLEARREIFDIFPELADMNHNPNPARHIPKGPQQARLVARHLKNEKPPLQGYEV
ncbi:Hint domain-containing protein [Ruegeria sp. Alg231-54]|uniref:Hint domain-containing protein n=1 Tax=Ruegeria sp. Alg231-54 TaxID=1922221 RepID=UPI000D562AFC|nr:Hint domain-containing protein [Ruegeria sp. Alg231-54]